MGLDMLVDDAEFEEEEDEADIPARKLGQYATMNQGKRVLNRNLAMLNRWMDA